MKTVRAEVVIDPKGLQDDLDDIDTFIGKEIGKWSDTYETFSRLRDVVQAIIEQGWDQ